MLVDGANHMLHHTATASSSTNRASLGHPEQRDYPGLEGYHPQWLLLEGNEWRKRVAVAQRFINAVRVVVYRNRAQARLRKLKAMAGEADTSRWLLAGTLAWGGGRVSQGSSVSVQVDSVISWCPWHVV
jgi:hypothetical protein